MFPPTPAQPDDPNLHRLARCGELSDTCRALRYRHDAETIPSGVGTLHPPESGRAGTPTTAYQIGTRAAVRDHLFISKFRYNRWGRRADLAVGSGNGNE